MTRETSRKIAFTGNMEHVEVKRNKAGTAQLTQTAKTTGNTVKGTIVTTPFTTTLTSPSLLLFSSATLKGSGGGTANTVTLSLLRDGSQIAKTSGTAAVSTTTNATFTTPATSPSFQVKVDADGGTNTWTLTLSREDRWT